MRYHMLMSFEYPRKVNDMTFAANQPRSGQLLPSEVALRSSRVFGRARNYPIFSFAWYRYRSLAIVAGTLFVFASIAALLWAPSADPRQPGLVSSDVWLALSTYLLPILVLVLAGPLMATWVHSRGLPLDRELVLMTALLLLGVCISIASEFALKAWLERPVVDKATGNTAARSVPGLQMRIFLLQAKSSQTYTFGMTPELKEAARELSEANESRATHIAAGKTHQVRIDEQIKSIAARLADPATSPQMRAELATELNRRIAVLGQVDGAVHEPDERQKRAIERYNALVQEQSIKYVPPAPAIDRELAATHGRGAMLFLVVGVLGIIFWLGGFADLVAYVRQRDKLDDVLQRQALEKAETARGAAEARLSVLAAQVEPHFLFNSLASVRSAITSDPQRATHIIDQMVNYLRSTIPQMRDDAGKSTVPLATQLDSVRSYLALMHERMPRLSVDVNAEEGLEAAMVPPLMLISLVENAIKHGIEPKVGAGSITVHAKRSGTDSAPVLELSVLDDGVGFGAATSGGGIGLSNIQARLRTYFGQAAGLTLKARPGGGVAAILHLPLSFEP